MRHFACWVMKSSSYCGLWAMSLAYLVCDFFPQIQSVAAILTTPAFWILWAVFGFLNAIAFGLLSTRDSAPVAAIINAPHLALAAVQFLSTIGVYSVLQSFSLQFAGQRVVDVEKLVASFRAEALEAARARKVALDRGRAGSIEAGLRSIYKNDFQALTEDYTQVMHLAGLKVETIEAQFNAYTQSAGLERELRLTELVMRIPVTDMENARRLLKRRRA